MNLFLEFQVKIFNLLKKLEKKKIIKIPPKLKGISVQLPPSNQESDISCNAAMILSKHNNSPSLDFAEIYLFL